MKYSEISKILWNDGRCPESKLSYCGRQNFGIFEGHGLNLLKKYCQIKKNNKIMESDELYIKKRFGKEQSFTVPSGYFESLSGRISRKTAFRCGFRICRDTVATLPCRHCCSCLSVFDGSGGDGIFRYGIAENDYRCEPFGNARKH